MSHMEEDARDLLKRTLMTVSLGSLWLLINSTLGLMLGGFFFEGRPGIWNYLFYAWFLLSLGALIWYFIKIWKRKFKVD